MACSTLTEFEYGKLRKGIRRRVAPHYAADLSVSILGRVIFIKLDIQLEYRVKLFKCLNTNNNRSFTWDVIYKKP